MNRHKKIITGLLLLISPAAFAFEPQEQTVLNQLKSHYEYVEDLNKISVNYIGERQTRFQSNNYLNPYIIKSRYQSEYDLEAKEFYFEDHHVYPGNYIFDNSIIHKDGKTILYDRNGFTKGKQLRYLDYSFSEFKQDLTEDIDILAAHDLFQFVTKENTSIEVNANEVKLTLNSDGTSIYHFSLSPIQLTSITYPEEKREIQYSNQVNQMGINYASTVKHFKNDKLKNNKSILDLKKISGIKQGKLQIPDGYGPFIDDSDKALQWIKLATDLYLINYVSGDRHVLVKKDNIGLTVFGAPSSDKVSKQVVQFINKNIPKQRIHSVYITHAHSDHMRGLNYYANSGVSIIADQYTISAIKAFPKFSETINEWKFKTIQHKQSLNNAIYYVPKNSHSDGQSFVYFPASKIIYQGDFLEIPFDNSLPTHMADVEKEFIDFLRVEKINYSRIVGHHRNNNMTPKVVNAYYRSHHNL